MGGTSAIMLYLNPSAHCMLWVEEFKISCVVMKPMCNYLITFHHMLPFKHLPAYCSSGSWGASFFVASWKDLAWPAKSTNKMSIIANPKNDHNCAFVRGTLYSSEQNFACLANTSICQIKRHFSKMEFAKWSDKCRLFWVDAASGTW